MQHYLRLHHSHISFFVLSTILNIMKKHWSILGATALVMGAVLPVNGAPLISQAVKASNDLAQNILQQPKVELNLTAQQQVIQKDAAGKAVKSWVPADKQVTVKPGDVLKFTVVGHNVGNKAAQNMAITQPIPNGTVLVANTTQASTTANVTYSIDRGQTFVANPMVKVKLANGQTVEQPAPIATYTHVRWQLTNALGANHHVDASYQVAVR
jgi:uncharacterized repeat protein (TIGR01451 family)